MLDAIPEIIFKIEQELFKYYNKYEKRARFGIMTQRNKREHYESVKCITIGYACGDKANNRTTNLKKPHPTMKIDRKVNINAILVES